MLSQRAQWIEGEPIASRLMAQAMAHPGLISLAAGFVDHQTLPVEPVRRAWEAVWADPKHAAHGVAVRHDHRLPAAAASTA